MSENPKWIVSIKGGTLTSRFSEIAVVRTDYPEGIISFGHFGPKKFLIAHNGGPVNMERNIADRKLIMWPVSQIVWESLIKIAHEIADIFNAYDT
jgi:hypothetical protein